MPLNVTAVLASRTFIKNWWLHYSHCPLDLKHDSWLCFPTFLYLLELGLNLLFWFVCSYFQLPLFTHFREKKNDGEISWLSISILLLNAGI